MINLFRAALVALFALVSTPAFPSGDHGHGHAHGESAHEESAAKGPHGGRLLQQGDFALEVTIHESGVPPEYRLYAYRDGRPLAPQQVTATIELQRLGGGRDRFRFAPEGDYLRGDGEVSEPHSFDVTVHARVDGKDHQWHYDSYEGRTTIAARAADVAGIEVEPAGPAPLRETLSLHGRVVPDANRHYRIAARYPGIVQSVGVQVGDAVAAGATLAVVESRDSLQRYAVKAPSDGVVLARHVNAGSAAGDEVLFEIADLSRLMAELNAFPADIARLSTGQAVQLRDTQGQVAQGSAVAGIAPAYGAAQSALVRVPLDNGDGRWRIGQAVGAEVEVAKVDVPLAVRADAIQSFRDMAVVFARYGDVYEVRMIETGRRSRDYVEVLGGIEPGTPYVTRNSFLVKADVMKSGASHDH